MLFSHAVLPDYFATPWIVVPQAPLSMDSGNKIVDILIAKMNPRVGKFVYFKYHLFN